MSGDLSDFGEDLAARWLVTDEAATRPTAWSLALYSTAPTDAGGGTELAGNGYARQAATFSDGGAGFASSTGDLTFTATADWLPIVAAGLFDDGGNLLLWKVISPSVNIIAGQSFIVRAGQLTVKFA